MKKICLTVIGLYILLLNAYSQNQKDSLKLSVKDSAVYISKPLQLEEINLVSSYYNQNGHHSAITGGIGTELVTDISNGIDLNFKGADEEGYKYGLTAGLGIDYHTAASSAYVSKTGASSTGGTRIYPSISYSEEDKNGTVKEIGLYYSAEFNYHSFGIDGSYLKKLSNGGELTTKFSTYFDKVKLIYPSELRPQTAIVVSSASSGGGGSSIPSSPRYTYTGTLSYAQTINQKMQASITLDAVGQNGLLSLPFHRVYFTDGTDNVETLPSFRFKLPVGLRFNFFVTDNVILRTYYRFYTDTWGITAHTASLEIPVKITPFLSVSPFYRYYIQTASTYFAPYEVHSKQDSYYTSNYAYSAFNSSYFGAGIHSAPPGGVWKTAITTMDIRYGHYTQTTGLNSNTISVSLQFKQ